VSRISTVSSQLAVAVLGAAAPAGIRLATENLLDLPQRRLSAMVEPQEHVVRQRRVDRDEDRSHRDRIGREQQRPVDVEQRERHNAIVRVAPNASRKRRS
jgi:hypothetical protein